MNVNETIELNDLTLTDDQQAEVKGGPIGDSVDYTFTVTNTSCVSKLAGVWGGAGSDAYQQTQQRWDS